MYMYAFLGEEAKIKQMENEFLTGEPAGLSDEELTEPEEESVHDTVHTNIIMLI